MHVMQFTSRQVDWVVEAASVCFTSDIDSPSLRPPSLQHRHHHCFDEEAASPAAWVEVRGRPESVNPESGLPTYGQESSGHGVAAAAAAAAVAVGTVAVVAVPSGAEVW
mmetsp:Transcript_28247/g.42679  ORF Transcript_28247/g.42679 Transcript_28247/m.42679 type:complete len:109 (+) Transcript_28247:114-440(+)